MTSARLLARLKEIIRTPPPLPGRGQTAERHAWLFNIGREDLSVARLVEAHCDALAILADAARTPQPDTLYGVWASEIPGQALQIDDAGALRLRGTKRFCSGAGLVDRALVTAGSPQQQLVDVDMRLDFGHVQFDFSSWKTTAFSETQTATVTFAGVPITPEQMIEAPDWYLDRPGFWHGACGPAACWAGGADRLLQYALRQRRDDPHTLAHLGAMHASLWALRAYLDSAGREIDKYPQDRAKARVIALTLRHLVERDSSDVLGRLTRAFGPHPLALDEAISRQYQELHLYLRQSHAERDLEILGTDVKRPPVGAP
jgi:alkylation response protein AidB-like acyl-CoA dehydrogenase